MGYERRNLGGIGSFRSVDVNSIGNSRNHFFWYMAMQLEKQIDGLTVTIEGRAGTELVFAGHGEYPDEWEAYWIDEPRIVDVHNNYYDVSLTEEEEWEILESLDINYFVC